MMRDRWARVLAMVAALMFASDAAAQADVAERIGQILKTPILESGTTLAETRAIVDASVPRMPQVDSLADWEAEAERLRREVLDRVVLRGEARGWRDAKLGVEWGAELEGGPGYRLRKLRYEALPGLWIPAVLYAPADLRQPAAENAAVADRRPVFLNVNGHDGNGKAADYKQIRCINLAKRGIIALNVEWLGMGQLRSETNSHAVMNQLDLCGTSGLAPFYLSMSRGIDVLLAHPHADPQRVGVAGLSGGGWQTITISSLDTRVTLTNPVAGYSSFLTRNQHTKDLGDSEQTPTDLATVADYTHLTAMMAPRATLLTFNTKDNCCFEGGYALPPLMAAADPIFKLFGRPDRLRTHLSSDPGDHNFGLDNRQALYRMVGDHFYPGDEAFVMEEIASESEVKTAEALAVDLPADNASLNGLALTLAQSLPRDPALPTATALPAWQTQRRETLREIVRWPAFSVTAENVSIEREEGFTATRLRLKLGDVWTLAAVEFAPANPSKTVLLVTETGLANSGAAVRESLQQGARVVVVDPFYFGESKFASHDYLQALLLATIGQRPLGIQAAQVAAVARWLHERDQMPAELVAVGRRASLFALVAAALEPEGIAGVTLQGSRASLREVIERNEPVTSAPEAFCFGLLEQFDTPQLAALVAPRKLAFLESTPRHQETLNGLRKLYDQLGGELVLSP